MFKPISKIFLLFILLILFSFQSSINLESKIQTLSDHSQQVIKAHEISKSLNVIPDYGKIPLYFIPNKGQVDENVLFYAKASRYTLWMTKEGLVFDSIMHQGTYLDASPRQARYNTDSLCHRVTESLKFERDVSRLIFLNTNKNLEVDPFDITKHRVNYIIGTDKSKWKTNILTSKAVLYKELYNNIDLKVYGIEREIEYDWIVKPGGEVSDINLEYKNVKNTKIDKKGNLVVGMKFGQLRHAKPLGYQVIGGKKIEVEANFKEIRQNTFRFEIGKFNKNYELIIDPLVYCTYHGGSDVETGRAIAVDKKGAAYVAGYTKSTDFPTQNPINGTKIGGDDIYITKINPQGNALLYSTYMGGSDNDYCWGIAVDKKGAAYVTGLTNSTDFPTKNPVQGTIGGNTDTFITKINPQGSSLAYSTYLGGSDTDYGYAGIAVDKKGSAYVTGQTRSTDFPTKNPIQGTIGGSTDTYVAKINPQGSALVYSTYLGGSDSDFGWGIAVDEKGAAYITGSTYSPDFPTKNPVQKNHAGGNSDAFITKINAKGSALVYSTYHGGSGYDYGSGITVDKKDSAYVTGGTESTDFPTKKPIQKKNGGDQDSFITKIHKKGKRLIYSTYHGGSDYDYGYGITVDKKGNAYVAGGTKSTDFPTKNPVQKKLAGDQDGSITKIHKKGKRLVYSTYHGGSDYDYCYKIAVDEKSIAYVVGSTNSTDFPTKNPVQKKLAGNQDAFITKIK